MASPTTTSVMKTKPTTTSWNTHNLPLRLGSDVVAAGCAAGVITPIITLIDRYIYPPFHHHSPNHIPTNVTPSRSIMESASGRSPNILSSLRSSLSSILASPLKTLLSRPFGLVFLLYGGTYLTANALDTASSTVHNRPATSITSGAAKFAASSAANVSLCVYKDQAFVRLFGSTAASSGRPVPLPCYALFAARDCLTIFASFNVPPLLAPYLENNTKIKLPFSMSGATAAQFAAPAAVQLISTPLHLLGLDLYNRPGETMAERWRQVRSNWGVCAAARIGRIIPAFGVGGVVNMKVRKTLMGKLE